MTALDPRLLAEQVIRDHTARIDDGCVIAHIGRQHPELADGERVALCEQVADLIAGGDYTLTFAEEGE